MGEQLPSGGLPARKEPDSGTDADVRTWFSPLARTLVPSNAGLVLHYLTGCEERSCYRWAAGETPVSGWFVRQLLRSEQGGVWLNGIMDGADVRWWRDHQAAQMAQQKIDSIRQIVGG